MHFLNVFSLDGEGEDSLKLKKKQGGPQEIVNDSMKLKPFDRHNQDKTIKTDASPEAKQGTTSAVPLIKDAKMEPKLEQKNVLSDLGKSQLLKDDPVKDISSLDKKEICPGKYC